MVTLKTKEVELGIVVFASDENKVRYNIIQLGEQENECAACLLEKLDKPIEEMFRVSENKTVNPQDELE